MSNRSIAAILALCVASIGAARIPHAASGQRPDLVIRQARVFDGSGNPWFVADVAVTDGRIVQVGDLGDVHAKRIIDAKGRYLAPGFIDIHSHSDRGLGDPRLNHNINMAAQGITLSVVNQDGRSPWPIRDQKTRYEKQGIGTMPPSGFR